MNDLMLIDSINTFMVLLMPAKTIFFALNLPSPILIFSYHAFHVVSARVIRYNINIDSIPNQSNSNNNDFYESRVAGNSIPNIFQ